MTKIKLKPVPWTPENEKQLIEMVGDLTLSCGDIAERMGTTKNAIVGKLRRMGVAKPTPTLKPYFVRAKQRKERKKKTGRQKPVRVSDLMGPRLGEPVPNGIDTECQWIHGEPHGRNFCGTRRKSGSSYCSHHHERAYIPRKKKLASEGVAQ